VGERFAHVPSIRCTILRYMRDRYLEIKGGSQYLAFLQVVERAIIHTFISSNLLCSSAHGP
jgi:hypothetical protein